MQPFLALGGVLWIISMLACAFATKLWHFFLIMVRLPHARLMTRLTTHAYLY